MIGNSIDIANKQQDIIRVDITMVTIFLDFIY